MGEQLRAVRDAPGDTAQLLAYTTWLEGQDPALAELVAVQVAREDGADSAALRERESALLAEHEARWLEPLRPAIDSHVWWRGLLGIDTTVEKFLAHAELLADWPAIRFIDISDWSADLEEDAWDRLVACPQFEWVTKIGVRARYTLDGPEQMLGVQDMKALAASPYTRRLFHLDVSFNWIEDEGLAALAGSSELSGLTELLLRGCVYGDAGLQALAAAEFKRLELIEASYCEGRPSAAGWASLIETAQLPSLHELWLLGNSLPPELQARARERWGSRVKF